MSKGTIVVLSLLLSILFISCGTGGRIKSLNRDFNEAIIIAKVDIFNNEEPASEYSIVFFDQYTSGSYAVKPDKNNYIYKKILVGKHHIAKIQMGNRSIKLPITYTGFETPEGKIYYIGDLTADLKLDFNVGAMFGLLGAIAYEERTVSVPSIRVVNNYEKAVTYFKTIFPCKDTILQSIMVVDSVNFKSNPEE
jgi:hypothetical protein